MITARKISFKMLFIACLVCAGLLLSSWPLNAAETKYTIRIGTSTPEKGRHTAAFRKFAQWVEKDLEGLVKFKIFPDAVLGTLTQQVEGLQVGTHDMTLTGAVIIRMVPEIGIIDLPYLFKSALMFERVMNGTSIGAELFKKCEARGLVSLGWLENGFRCLTNNVKPIHKPEDLKGIKVRTPPSPIRLEMFKAWGANPAPLSFKELFSALKQGVFDGQENPLNLIRDKHMYEVQKYLSLTKHVYNPLPILISKKLWDKLPPNVQASMRNNGRKAADWDRANGERLYQEAYDYLTKKMKVNEVDFDAFKAASKPVYDNWKHQDLLKRVLEITQ